MKPPWKCVLLYLKNRVVFGFQAQPRQYLYHLREHSGRSLVSNLYQRVFECHVGPFKDRSSHLCQLYGCSRSLLLNSVALLFWVVSQRHSVILVWLDFKGAWLIWMYFNAFQSAHGGINTDSPNVLPGVSKAPSLHHRNIHQDFGEVNQDVYKRSLPHLLWSLETVFY